MKGKNVDSNAEKGKNEMIHWGFEPGTFGTKVRKSLFSSKKLLIFKAENSNQEKFNLLAPGVHIFQASSKKTFELNS